MKLPNYKSMMLAMLLIFAASTASGANDSDTYYVDAAKNLTIINRAQTPAADSTRLARLDVDLYPQMSAQAARYGRYSTGLAVCFKTDSPFISARWTTGHHAAGTNMTAILQSGLDMYIKQDGKWIFAGVARPAASGTSHKWDMVQNMDGTMHECLLYLPTFTAVTSLEIGVKPGSVIEAVPNPFARRIVFVGSSITHGASASRPGLTYPAMIGRALDAEAANLGFSGICKLEQFYADIVADTKADVFVFDTFSNPGADEINERLKPFVDKIRKAHPNTPLIFVQTTKRETANFDMKKLERNNGQRAAAEAGMKQLIDAGDRNIYFINPGMPTGDDHEGTADGTHPTDASFRMITDNLLPHIKKVLK